MGKILSPGQGRALIERSPLALHSHDLPRVVEPKAYQSMAGSRHKTDTSRELRADLPNLWPLWEHLGHKHGLAVCNRAA